MAASKDTTAASVDEISTHRLFLHVQYKLPNLTNSDKSSEQIVVEENTHTPNVITQQSFFDESNCPAATVGLHPCVEPVKPKPGDYSYSGMHDHGPLPPPREGGQFAQIIGFVNAAKKASDAYLTDVIEKEKKHATSVASGPTLHKRKRK